MCADYHAPASTRLVNRSKKRRAKALTSRFFYPLKLRFFLVSPPSRRFGSSRSNARIVVLRTLPAEPSSSYNAERLSASGRLHETDQVVGTDRPVDLPDGHPVLVLGQPGGAADPVYGIPSGTGATTRKAAVPLLRGRGARLASGWSSCPSPARTCPSRRSPLARRADLGWRAGTTALAPRNSARSPLVR